MKKKMKDFIIETTMVRLNKLRKKQRQIRKDIDAMRDIVRKAGGNPDAPQVNLVPRNKEIYKGWKDGRSFKELGTEFKLTSARVSSICYRIDRILEVKKFNFKEYKDLLPYK